MLWAWVCYVLWGLFPAFFPLLKPASPLEILAHRFVWTLVFMLAIVLFSGQFKKLLRIPWRVWATVFAAAVLIAVNWGTYIVAVNSDHVADAALGYFINPLVSVLLGVFFLAERLRPLQWLSVGIAVVAVAVLTVDLGHPPVISLALAFSFGFYGLLKKRVPLTPMISLTCETLCIAPVAIVYLLVLGQRHEGTFTSEGVGHTLLLMTAGIVTAVPLLLFGYAAQQISLTSLGMLQYLTPVLQMLWAVFVTQESFSLGRWLGFIIIWVSVGFFMTDLALVSRKRAHPLRAPSS
ncbi:EamA family transporter RarD [Corynebacterium kroppenstedtii]|uniref:EamA family transporter RarD n=1 Tax=Corynebacterium kroppenstedtii TaxID=161879 RepID=A0A2W5U406_9CORY|nr:EamA family transporter RarD [Corynebacterium kroppenstedtii]MDU7287312.1 EamA family transporter RarD [Corynebacterium kroppenstedtii]PZR03438.1 MAG: EamA family transporter RarD [Corynebacterium kroppenstedtii]